MIRLFQYLPRLAPIRLHLYVAQDLLVWRLCRRGTTISYGRLAYATSFEAGLSELLGKLPHQPGALDICIDDALARHFVCPRPQGARTVADLRLGWQARFSTLYGEVPANWTLQGDLRLNSPSDLVCALPDDLLITLTATARSHRIGVLTLDTLWLRNMGRRDGWLVTRGAQGICIGLLAAGHCLGVRHLPGTQTDVALTRWLTQSEPLFPVHAARDGRIHLCDLVGNVRRGELAARTRDLPRPLAWASGVDA